MPRSPQIIIRERDNSSFPATTSDTIVAIIGYATKGPIGKAVELSGRNAFLSTFGSIPKNAPWGHMAAYKAFRQGKVIFYRIANANAAGAEYVINNGSDATAGYQEFLTTSVINYGEYVAGGSYDVTVQIDGQSTSEQVITLTAPTTGDWELNTIASQLNEALIAAFNTEAEDATASLVNGKIRITSGSTGATSSVDITVTGAANEDLVALLGGADTAVPGADLVDPTTTDNILLKAKEKGTDTNKIAVMKSTEFNSVEGRNVITISVWFDGEEIETFEDVSLVPGDEDFFATLMNREPENDGSSYVKITYEDQVEDGGDIQFPDGTYTLGSGTTEWTDGAALSAYDYRPGHDGAPESGGSGLFVDALSSTSDLANSELFNYHILLTPDNGSQTTQNAAISLAEARKDFFYIADPPFGLTYTEVTEWSNGQGYGRDAALNSSFTATYWPWLKDINPRDNEYLWAPPSVFLGEKLLQVDRNYAPWYAPAGDLRGRLVANDTETSPTLNQRDFIYGRPNCVNPIVNFATKGIVIYGQKTTLRSRSALDRVNVRRMAIYASKLIKESMEGLIFEPHLPDSWARATDFINRILEPIRRDNGLEDYQVIIDGTTNDADAIANNIMKGIIKLVPVNAIETIDLTISFLSPGVAIS